MRSVTTELVHLLFSVPCYLLAFLLTVAVTAFRAGPSSRLRQWRYALLAAALSYLLALPARPNLLVGYLEHVYDRPTGESEGAAPPLISLYSPVGSSVRLREGYEIKLAGSWERVPAAVDLWRKHGGVIVFYGAPLPDGSDSVAQAMARLAQRPGAPTDAIRVETHSENTHENLLFSRAMLGLKATDRIYLVTSALHMPRAIGIAHRLGLQPIAWPCDYQADERIHWDLWLPRTDAPEELEEALHEIVAYATYRWRGWI